MICSGMVFLGVESPFRNKVRVFSYSELEKKKVRLPEFESGLEAWEAPVLDQARPQPLVVEFERIVDFMSLLSE